ncbi:TPA: helix-turn-helix domain-containing protein, partial [Streptococcus agalactiae]
KDGFEAEVFNSLKETNDNLLNDPFMDTSSIVFFDKTYHKNNTLSFQLETFKHILPSLEINSVGYEEQFHKLMQYILNEHFNTYKEVESLSAIRTSTREELYRRICIAHDYIRAYYDKTIKLNDIARISCLSPNHLLRTYTQIYGKTPHQHISEFRVTKAKQLLSELSNNMTDITFKLGFGVCVHAHQLKNFHYPQVTKNVILSKKLARKGDIFYESFDSR